MLGSVGAVSMSPTLLATGSAGAAAAAASGQTPSAVQTELAFVGVFRMGPQQRGADASAARSAAILGGEVTGPLLQGEIQPGRIEWQLDAAGESVQISAHYAVRRPDGALVQVSDRSVHPVATRPAAATGLRTAPQISMDDVPAGQSPCLLVGVLDASGFSAGQVTLRAFRLV